ncbi:hypothetical protein AGOR_G00018300 [Albula goreensis]|uniref:Uncharacterized protein n=1 Tax=Albula goreensis TaxID=1534307 RepID=A0A8T3E057_9TELE|nr:hypothetical protein AGOR_G00018300 [Albula goreensis]
MDVKRESRGCGDMQKTLSKSSTLAQAADGEDEEDFLKQTMLSSVPARMRTKVMMRGNIASCWMPLAPLEGRKGGSWLNELRPVCRSRSSLRRGKITMSDLLGTTEQTPAINKTKKQLKSLHSRQETLELPLSRQQTEKIQRGVAYDKTSKEVSRWQGVVMRNERAEQLVFPLNQEPSGPKRVEQVVVGWKAQTPLEQEIFNLLHRNKQPVNDPILTATEEASLKAMSLEEAKIRRAELQKARVLQSYYEAKAKREKKIKSKKYHKVLKKAKRKEFLKEFEEMRKTNPEAALEELKKLELSRIEERMSLKHQNSGKWAKSRAIIAKYDTEARKAMQSSSR